MRSIASIAIAAIMLGACSRYQPLPAASYMYPEHIARSCPGGSTYLGGGKDAEKVVAGGLSYLVRVPANYDARFAHPLLVVYAAAGASGGLTERYTRLTPSATSHGLIVAYVDHRPMHLDSVVDLGGVARSVAKRWCVDLQRIYLTGHSDGGTVSTALALLPSTRAEVSGIAVSAAGFSGQDFQQMQCRPPIPVMIMHGARDTLFPGWGRQAAQWWARCNGCAASAGQPDPSGCVTFSRCPSAAPVLYCEGPQSHGEWPGLESRIVEFLLGQRTGSAAIRRDSQVSAGQSKTR